VHNRQNKEEVVKRRGFTLIELMVVIAIIIILAAIAIPNYLKMTERAKRSRLASDFATLATVLETFKTDWGIYPIEAVAQDVSDATQNIHMELAGLADATTNNADGTNAVGEVGPISYIKSGTLLSMKNPFIPANPVSYVSDDGLTGWVLYAQIAAEDAPLPYLTRTSSTSDAIYSADIPEVPAD
jgi:prepilin-type N-terminal cleavage/methylation domain-containing protein